MIGPALPGTLDTPIQAVKWNSWLDATVEVVGFGQYTNGCAYASFRFLNSSGVYTSPIRFFDF